MINVNRLSKSYGSHVAVNGVSFSCPPGTVTGFLGPNGAGKSTTMRMTVGLTPPSSGSATVHGLPYRRLSNPARQVGLLLDASAQHAGRTGRETLAVSAQMIGVGRHRVDEMLSLVSLSDAAANRRVGNYSLGMRQRLGLAHALLGGPDVLILDEPANGLDPDGIFWMRALLRDFADRGGTVLLSSHLLHEVEAVADRLVIISGGRISAEGDKADLLRSAGVRVRARDGDALRRALAFAGIESRATTDGALIAQAPAEAVGQTAAGEGLVRAPPGGRSGRALHGTDGGQRRKGGCVMYANPQAQPARTVRADGPTVWRLTATELRKMVDTRAGIALLVVIEVLVAGLVAVQLVTGRAEARTFSGFFTTSLIPVSILLPVLGILSVTSEWSQRTALTTFGLVPRRWRVLLAKVLGAAVLALLAVDACLATAAVGNLLGVAFAHGNGSWHLTGRMLGGAVLVQLLFVLMGVAFGLLLQSSPMAIVIYFVIPNAWSVLGNLVSWLRSWAAWLDLNTSTGPLLQDASLSGRSWAKVAASVGLWLVLPFGIGLIRLLREEVK